MRYFVTSSGTDIGKTFVTSLLIRQLKKAGKTARAYKPVVSGFDPASPDTSDTGILLDAMGLVPTPQQIDACSPYRYAAPLSPHIAAAREKRPIDTGQLVEWCRTRPATAEYSLFEGVGGVMVPLDTEHTVLDWMNRLNYPVILVTGSYVGSISHTLTAAAVLFQANISLHAIIVSESEGSSMPLDETVTSLRQFLPHTAHIRPLPRVKAWQDAPDLLDVIL